MASVQKKVSETEYQPRSSIPIPTAQDHGITSEYSQNLLRPRFVLDSDEEREGPLPKASAGTLKKAPGLKVSRETLRPSNSVNKVAAKRQPPHELKYHVADIESGGKGVDVYIRKFPTDRVEDVRISTSKTVEKTRQTIPSRLKKSCRGSRVRKGKPEQDENGGAQKRDTRAEPVHFRQKNSVHFENEQPLGSPDYNSTLAIGQQLQQLQASHFDAEAAMRKVLRQSEYTRAALAQKASEELNISSQRKKYSDLVSVNVPVEETLNLALENRVTKLQPHKLEPRKPPLEAQAPDIMELFSSDLLNESAKFSLIPLTPFTPIELEQAPQHTSFQIYKHMQSWESPNS